MGRSREQREMEEPAVRDLLGAHRQATLARISALTIEFEGIVATSVGSNIDDEHDPEGSTVAFERAQVTALLDEARTHLDDLGPRSCEAGRGDLFGVRTVRCAHWVGTPDGEARHPDLHSVRGGSVIPAEKATELTMRARKRGTTS